MRQWSVALAVVLLFGGCGLNMGRMNTKIFPKKAGQLEIECGKNLDLCKEKADLKCGYTGYKIISQKKDHENWRITVRCNK